MIARAGILFISFIICTPILAQDEAFVLVKKEGPIAIYERWVTFPESNPPVTAREVKGEFTFNNSILAALKLIQDEKKIFYWQHHVSEFKVFAQRDTSTWYEYSYHDIPWPVSDQDHFLEYKIQLNKSHDQLFITFRTRRNDKLAPIKKGVTRMELTGSWKLESLRKGHSKATYRIISMPSGIPRWLTDPIIHRNIMTTIEKFIELMNDNK